MPDKPTYPNEAAVGTEAARQESPAKDHTDVQPGAAKPDVATGAEEADDRRKKYVKAGVAVGIGSAAIVAALLYANRSKRSEKGGD